MKNIILFCLFILAFAPASAHAADKGSVYDRVVQSGTIRCGYFTWPPYIVKDPNTGALSGINYDFITEIGRILDLKIEWTEEANPGTAIEGLNNNRYDVMCASLWPDAARLKHALLSDPEFYSTIYVVTRKDDTRFDNGAASFNDPAVTIAGIEGDVTYNMILAHAPKAKTLGLPQMSDGGQLFQSILTKKADVVFMDKCSVADFNKTNSDQVRIAEGIAPVTVFAETLGVKKGEVELVTALNHALRIIVDSGKAEEFKNKYPQCGYYAPKPNWSK